MNTEVSAPLRVLNHLKLSLSISNKLNSPCLLRYLL